MTNEKNWAENFETFKKSAFRLETLPQYLVDCEAESFEKFKKGNPPLQPDKEHASWIETLESAKQRGASFSRVHLIPRELTDYLRFELCLYEFNAEAGDDIRLMYLDEVHESCNDKVNFDFWLFDNSLAFKVLYDLDGRYLGAERIEDKEVLGSCVEIQRELMPKATPLKEFLEKLKD